MLLPICLNRVLVLYIQIFITTIGKLPFFNIRKYTLVVNVMATQRYLQNIVHQIA